MSDAALSQLLRRVALKTDELDEDDSREEIVRFLANGFLERWEQESEEKAAAQRRVEQLVGRDSSNSSGKEYAGSIETVEDNKYINNTFNDDE